MKALSDRKKKYKENHTKSSTDLWLKYEAMNKLGWLNLFFIANSYTAIIV